MNMREYWANEAAMMRDKSGVLGKEVLMPLGNSSTPKKVGEDFRTGYWLEGNTIVFSTFVYDLTKKGIAERKNKKTSKVITDSYMLAAKNLQAGFIKRIMDDLAFKDTSKSELKTYFTNKISDSSINDDEKNRLTIILKEVVSDLITIEQDKNFALKYTFDFRWQVIDEPKYEYRYMFSDKELPSYYYMILRDGENTGGTHPNPTKRTNSAFFDLGISQNLTTASRTLVHESLHPVVSHIGSSDASNLLYTSYFKRFIDFIDLLKIRNLSDTVIARVVKDELKYETSVIRNNIMTTPEVSQLYGNYVQYFDDNYNLYRINDGQSLHILQLRKILEQL